MALTKVSRGLLSTGIVDNSTTTAITIDSSENVGIGGSTITDSNLLNIQGSSASVNVGVVFNDTNTSKIFAIQNGGSALKFFDYTASAERMRIDSSGNVGIGTSTVESTLHLQKASAGGRGATLTIDNNATSTVGNESQITFLTDAGASVAGTANARIKAISTDAGNGATALTFTTWSGGAEGERMRIGSEGNTAITAQNFHPLSLDRAGQDTAGQVSVAANGTVQAYWGSNSSALLRVSNNSFDQKMLVDHSGNLTTAGSVNSDRDLKENIADIPDGSLTLVKQLQPRTFNFLESFGFGTESRTGFIAQEVADVFTTDNRVVTGTDGESNMGVDPLGMIAHLTKAIQEQQATIEALTQRIETLENN